VVEPVECERAPDLPGAPVAEVVDRLHVAALHVVREVVADLRGERGGGAFLADVDAGAALDLLAQRRRGRVELDERAEDVEQHRPHRAHAIHSHAAN
jgi:hypothetical protein